MANLDTLDPVQCGSLPENDLSNPNLSIDFDSIQFPPIDTDFLTDDLTLPEGLMADLGFDDDFDFNFDDIYLPNENEGLGIGGEGSDGVSSTVTGLSQVSGGDQNSDDSGKVLNSLSPESGSCDREFTGPVSSQDSGCCGSGVSGFLNSPSPDSGGDSAAVSASSFGPVSSIPDVSTADQKVKLEEEAKECLSKRKKEIVDENPNPRNSKVRKSIPIENMTPVFDDEDKKKARLMRNRESAQLSRQRKKHYVEELEDKVRAMHSTIAELNGKISFVMAENASLRQQLSGGAVHPPPGMYPPPPMAHIPYPWIPHPAYPMRSQGSQVPLVPLPRLKTQQPVSSSKAKKSENKKKESKTKKVASVSFLGLLFFMFLFGVLVPSVRQNKEMGNIGLGLSNSGSTGWPRGRVLTVNGSDHNVGVGLCSGKPGFREHDSRSLSCKRDGVGRGGVEVKQDRQGMKNGFKPPENASEPLVASLYVPRNDKLVKIDGNLIIHSVLASEKAMASRGKGPVSSASKGKETGLAIPGDLAPALLGGGRNVERRRNMYRSAVERQKALTSGSRDGYKDNSRSTAADGSLQKWFREGLAGPILSSGMCTEVFQFDVSDPAAIIPATSISNVTVENGTDTGHLNKRNRRILNHLPIPIAGSAANGTEEQAGGPSQDDDFKGNSSASSMIVSVLVDPREAGDGEGGDGMIRPKSLSRIFVVVLLDSVKYVTYSCVLPLKGSGPHLVTT